MTIGSLHKRSLLAVAMLGPIGVMSGSVLLAVAGGLLCLIIAASAGRLYETRRPKVQTIFVHAFTLAGLIAAVAIFRTARIDAVLLVLLFGLFNRLVLRAGHRDDLLIMGASSVLLAAATTVTPGLGFALILCLYVPAALWALWIWRCGTWRRRLMPSHCISCWEELTSRRWILTCWPPR